MTGRYSRQGQQMLAGLKLWAHRSGATLSVEDDQSRPEDAIQILETERRRGASLFLGPYGSDSVRAVARAFRDDIIWNHGAAADDVQRLPNVISIPTPSSRYLVALARAVALLRPGARAAVATARGRFAEHAWNGLLGAAPAIDVEIAGRFQLAEVPGEGYDAILAIGPIDQEVALFQRLLRIGDAPLLGGVSPGLAAFPDELGENAEGLLAPVQWHPSLGSSPQLGPSSAQVAEDARSMALEPIDYVAAQVYAAGLIADYCYQRDPANPQRVARALRTSTFFGDFELDPTTGEQRGHEMAVIQWRNGRQELVAQPQG